MSFVCKTGVNCWRIEHAEKLRFIIDGSDYFRFLREALKIAQRSVYILSWDIDSRTILTRNGIDDGYPDHLGDFLNALAAEKPDLNIYILNWDFAVLYTLDRELLPLYKLGWKTHDRVHFRLDGHHPEGASQHQKIVVIDEAIAFIGGLDLTKGRWDTSDHMPGNPKRDRIDNKISRPYHDVQVMLSGDAAGALAELARDRWSGATGTAPTCGNERRTDGWPEHIVPDIEDVKVGLSRTLAAYQHQAEVREIQALYADAIGSAQDFIYIENQYFTAASVGNAIQSSLERERGPEIVMVMPKHTDGWLPQHTLDLFRLRLIRRLKKHDKDNRLNVFFPDGPGLDDDPINVHAKLMIVDNHIVTAGSANLNNRSMGLDSECNIVIEAENNSIVEEGIAAFRNRLMAEHLGSTPDNINESVTADHSLIKCIKKYNHPTRRHLRKLPLDLPQNTDRLLPDTEMVDPEHPIRPELMLRYIVPEGQERPTRSRIAIWIFLIGLIAGLSAMWRWTPLGNWLTVDALSGTLDMVRHMPVAPLWIIPAFVMAGFLAIPFTLLIVAAVIIFGPVTGFLCSLTGGVLSAVTVYWIGELIGRNTVQKLAGTKLNKISRKIARHGIVNIIFVRIVPIAPFTVINLVAGASHINFRDYVLGTLVGMTPGVMAVAVIADRIYATVQDPRIHNSMWLAASVAFIGFVAFILVNWLRRGSDQKSN